MIIKTLPHILNLNVDNKSYKISQINYFKY